MLRKTYQSDYIKYAEYFGLDDYNDPNKESRDKYINVIVDDNVLTGVYYDNIWVHLSVLNENTIAMAGHIYLILGDIQNKPVFGLNGMNWDQNTYINIDLWGIFKDKHTSHVNIISNNYNFNFNDIEKDVYDTGIAYGSCTNTIRICDERRNVIDIGDRPFGMTFRGQNGLKIWAVELTDVVLSQYSNYVNPNTQSMYLFAFELNFNIVLHTNGSFNIKNVEKLKKNFRVYNIYNTSLLYLN